MIKKLFFILLVLFSFNFAQAELRIGFVKVDEILKQAPQSELSNKKLEAEFKTRTEKLKKDIGLLNDKEKEFKKNSLTLSDKDKEKKQKDLQQTRIDIQRTERELREDIDLRRREEINKLQDQVTIVIEKVAIEKKYDLIFYTGVAYASEQVNITPDILKALENLK